MLTRLAHGARPWLDLFGLTISSTDIPNTATDNLIGGSVPGSGPAEAFLGDTTVTTNGSVDAAFDVILPAVKPGNVITATATDAAGDTSELSACRAVAP